VAEALRTRRADLRDIRVAVLVDHRAAVLDPDVGASFDRAVVDLVQLGAEVRDVALPEERAALDAGLLVLLAEAAAVHVPWLRERPDEYGADVRAQLER
jgi:aspartyl-tRNA(Asn)/glutamyl-tRNA(Gln) amidotransferase subunit A